MTQTQTQTQTYGSVYRQFLGLPFGYNGRGPKFYDCWGLYIHIVRTLSKQELPRYLDIEASNLAEVARTMYKEKLTWQEVPWEDEKPLDCVLMREPVKTEEGTLSHAVHVGCALGAGRMIHIKYGINSVMEKWRSTYSSTVSPFVGRRVVGLYRYKYKVVQCER